MPADLLEPLVRCLVQLVAGGEEDARVNWTPIGLTRDVAAASSSEEEFLHESPAELRVFLSLNSGAFADPAEARSEWLRVGWRLIQVTPERLIAALRTLGGAIEDKSMPLTYRAADFRSALHLREVRIQARSDSFASELPGWDVTLRITIYGDKPLPEAVETVILDTKVKATLPQAPKPTPRGKLSEFDPAYLLGKKVLEALRRMEDVVHR